VKDKQAEMEHESMTVVLNKFPAMLGETFSRGTIYRDHD
jgi:hypothetical protein